MQHPLVIQIEEEEWLALQEKCQQEGISPERAVTEIIEKAFLES